MKNNFVLLLLLLFFFISCGKVNQNKKDYQKGIILSNKFYDNNSFITVETIEKSLEVNKLDFIIWTTNSEYKKNSNDLYKNISNIEKNLKNKNSFFVFDEYSNKTIEKSDNILFINGYEEVNSKLRLLKTTKYFNLYETDFKSRLKDFSQNYVNLLDRGFIFGVSTIAELVGPEWTMPSKLSLYVPSKTKNKLREKIETRETYISQEDISIIFNINGFSFGSIINKNNEKLNYTINLNSEKVNIAKIQLLSNNNETIVEYMNIKKTKFVTYGEILDKSKFSYYILKIYFENNSFAITSPIWVIEDNSLLITKSKIKLEDTDYSINKKIQLEIENINLNRFEDVKLKVFSDNKTYYENTLSFEPHQIRTEEIPIIDNENTDDITINIILEKNREILNKKTFTIKKQNGKKILITTFINNRFSKQMTRLKNYLEETGYLVSYGDNIKYFLDEKRLSSYSFVIFTPPQAINIDANNENKFLYALQKYVYNGGNLLLAGFSDSNKIGNSYLNRILLVLNSNIRFRVDQTRDQFLIYDDQNNFKGKYLPKFTKFNEKFYNSFFINEIYLENATEIYAVYSNEEVPVQNIYGVMPLVYFSETTNIENRKYIDKNKTCSALLSKFGKGKIIILSGINFNDEQIDNLDNKQWILYTIDNTINQQE